MNPHFAFRMTILAAIAIAATPISAPAATPAPPSANRLAHADDPYLLLHAHNPVDWYPWGSEALEKAKRENKPIFLSIGYSTCYWCHIAEREIYSNPEIAKLMNRWFVNIKVDREQRPDIDRLYMVAREILTGDGGWPNNLFLTPDLKPFFAGSYFPPKDRNGAPGFPTVLRSLRQTWEKDRAKALRVAEEVSAALQKIARGDGETSPVDASAWLARALAETTARFDEIDGGFGPRPTKFPQPPLLSMLLVAHAQSKDPAVLKMATTTLMSMAQGGVMDQLGGGFHRYSTEPSWSIPHFEKMIEDNAQLLGVYAEAYKAAPEPLFRDAAERTARYLTAEMHDPGSGFFSAQDAEVAGVEGVSYLWTQSEIETILGAADAKRWFDLYSLTPVPEAASDRPHAQGGVLRLDRAKAEALAEKRELVGALAALAPLRDKLLAERKKRPQPARDEKIVTSGNALAIMGFAEAADALGDKALAQTAIDTANWLWTHAFDAKSGVLAHQFFRSQAGQPGFLDDYALLAQAFLALRKTTGDAIWTDRARQIADAMLTRFSEPDGHLAETWDKSSLLASPSAEGDSVQPSGLSSAVAILLELSTATADKHYADAAGRALSPLASRIGASPSSWGALLVSLSRPELREALKAAKPAAGAADKKLPSSADHVRLRAQWAQSPTGGVVEATIDVEAGYHINANPASDPDLVPTTLTLDGYPNLHVEYPAGRIFKPKFASNGINVYEGHVTLRVSLPSAPASPRRLAHLRLQACNDQLCLAPAEIDASIEIGSAKP